MQLSYSLDEICKVAADKATAALSKFLQTPVGVEMNPAEVKHIDGVAILMDSNSDVVALSLPITGALPGWAFSIFSEQAGLSLCDELLFRQSGVTKAFHDAEISALAEIANIVIGNFLTSFAQSLKMDTMMHHSATFELGKFGALFEKISSSIEKNIGKLVVKICFLFQHANIQGYVIVVFDEKKLMGLFPSDLVY